jgi:hypothetical protein
MSDIRTGELRPVRRAYGIVLNGCYEARPSHERETLMTIPTEPIGSIPRPLPLIEAIASTAADKRGIG